MVQIRFLLFFFVVTFFLWRAHFRNKEKNRINKININWNTVTTYITSIESGQSSSNTRKVWLKSCKFFFHLFEVTLQFMQEREREEKNAHAIFFLLFNLIDILANWI